MLNLRDENVMRELNLYPLWVRKNVPSSESASLVADQPQVSPSDDVVGRVSTRQETIGQPKAVELQPQGVGRVSAEPNLHQYTHKPDLHAACTNENTIDWPALKQQVASCTACKLRAGCTQTVFGAGDENADWLFVGDWPTTEDVAQDQPFVGQAGKLLDNMLASIKLKRGQNVYIANVVKCGPAENHVPTHDEIAQCLPYLQQQIALIKPKVIVALGKTAATALLGKDATLGSLRGKLHDYQGVPLLITYHPAYLLRTPAEKAHAWDDLCMAVETMKQLQGTK
ncbi:MAG: uracil-DNA glycosylase [Gallionellaceae bacterium]|nr:uracil-DNA glycosylase [Gallionellaceae bacterium]